MEVVGRERKSASSAVCRDCRFKSVLTPLLIVKKVLSTQGPTAEIAVLESLNDILRAIPDFTVNDSIRNFSDWII